MIVEDYKGVRCYRENGTIYPSVHAVLNVLLPSDPAWMDDVALETGRECHAVMASYLLGRPHPCFGEVEFRTDAAKKWITQHGIEVFKQLTECSCHSKYGFAGTPDAALRLTDGTPYLIDWKFAEAITLVNRIQVETAYTRFEEYKGFRPMIVQVTKSGAVMVHKLKVNHHHWPAFLSAANILNWRLGNT
jgi:hypothetical protein